MTVDIILATYNGEKYLGEQIESLLSQSYKNFNLYIRDDGSKDRTPEILEDYAKRDSRIQIIKDKLGNLGPAKNFEALVGATTGQLIAFSDQDDIWFSNKLERLVSETKTLDQQKPFIVFSDCYLMYGEEETNKRFLATVMHRSPGRHSFNRSLYEGYIQGSGMIVNRELVKIALPCGDIYMHDHYFTIVAEAFGTTKYLNEPLMFYRQHDKNEVGAKKLSFLQKVSGVLTQDAVLQWDKVESKDAIAFMEKGLSLGSTKQKCLVRFMKLRSDKTGWLTKLFLIPFSGLSLRAKLASVMLISSKKSNTRGQ